MNLNNNILIYLKVMKNKMILNAKKEDYRLKKFRLIQIALKIQL